MNGEGSQHRSDPSLDPAEVRRLYEFGCWTVVLLAPLLSWINGPPVSPDQAVVRTVVFSLALTGAVGLRIAALLRNRRSPEK